MLRRSTAAPTWRRKQIAGQPILRVRIKQDEIARYGVPAEDVLDLVESLGGKVVGNVIEGQLPFPLAVRLPERLRHSPETIAAHPGGRRRPASAFRCRAWPTCEVVQGPKLISREWGKRRPDGAVQRARPRHRQLRRRGPARRSPNEVELPAGYRIEWGGQFENMQRAQKRLMIVVPLALALIVVLLYLTYRNVVDTLFVFASVPFACVGGVLALWVREMPLSISAAVGFITLSGVSVLNSMMLVSLPAQPARRGGSPARQAVEKACADVPADGADDGAGGQRRLHSDGDEHGHGRRGAAAAGDRGHRRRDHAARC